MQEPVPSSTNQLHSIKLSSELKLQRAEPFVVVGTPQYCPVGDPAKHTTTVWQTSDHKTGTHQLDSMRFCCVKAFQTMSLPYWLALTMRSPAQLKACT